MTQIIVAFLTGIAGPILLILVKNYLDKKKKPDLLIDAVEHSKLISDKIEELKEEIEVDRIWVAQFHNGGHFYPTGKSIAKFSIFYETVQVGVSSIQSNFQNIPVNLFSKAINELLENDIIEIPDFKDPSTPTFGLKYIAEDTGCKSGYLFAIKSIDGKYIGILGLDFTKKPVNLSDDTINHLSKQAFALGGALMAHLQSN